MTAMCLCCMSLPKKCLCENVNNIQSKSWNKDRLELRLYLAQPVQAGEREDIKLVMLSYHHFLHRVDTRDDPQLRLIEAWLTQLKIVIVY